MAPPTRWSAERVAEAAAILYRPSSDAAQRRQADRELSAFQHCDFAVPISLGLLSDAQKLASLGQPVGEALALLAAQTVRRRAQRPQSLRGPPPAPELVLQLAEAFQPRDMRVAEALARAAAALWLHAGKVPMQELLGALSGPGGSPTTPPGAAAGAHGARAAVALVALAALPEEAKEAPGPERAEALRLLSAGSLQVLGGLAAAGDVPPALQLAAAASWLAIANSLDVLGPLSQSSLVPLALQCTANGGEAAPAATEFLEVLLRQSGTSAAALAPLADAVLALLAAARPATAEARRALARFVAEAVSAWCWLFLAAGGTSPAPQWEQLLEVLLSCSAWGVESAVVTLPAWTALHGAVGRAGLTATYAPVFARAVRALRVVSRFPPGFEGLSLEAQDAFRDFRDELRDLLRRLVHKEALTAFVAEVCEEAVSGSADSWQQREEPLHALSAVAAAVCAACRADGGAALEPAAAVLRTLAALTGGAASTLAGHRQLLCTFLVCSSVFVPVLALPHRRPGMGQGLEAALGQVLEIARFSLGIVQEVASGPDAAYPFRAKQDHAGAVCILKLCMGCSAELASGQAEVFQLLRKDHATQLEATLQQAPNALQEPSLLVLTQALSLVAEHHADLAQGLLSDCLAAASSRGGQANLAMSSAVEAVSRCKAQAEAIGRALDASWGTVVEACKAPADPSPVCRLLAAVAEAAPIRSLEALARLVANTFECRQEARVALFGPAIALAHRAKAEPDVTALVAELLPGLSRLAWSELDHQSHASGRLRLGPLPEVRHPGDAGQEALELAPSERALLEAWMRYVWEAGRAVPAAVGGEALLLALRAAAAALQVPHHDPPARTLGLLAEAWADEGLAVRWREALESEAMPQGWCLGALVLRALLKAMLGQMPTTAVGVVVPAARGLLSAGGPIVFAAWARRAVDGEGFPNAATKEDAKARFVKELVEAEHNPTHFKQLLKRFGGAGKK